jgi:hypothetical protein
VPHFGGSWSPPQNRLLLALRGPERTRFRQKLQSAVLPLGQVLHEPGERLEYVYFPTSSLISLVYTMRDGATAEMGLVGNDGVLGVELPPGAPCPDPTSPTYLTDPRGTFVADPPSPTVQVGPTYLQALTQGAPRPLWYGGDYKVTLRGCDFPESCAYDFQLCAWKRTTNGCDFSACLNLDYNVFDITLTILLS